MTTMPPLPPVPPPKNWLGFTISEMRAYATKYGAACAAAERERTLALLDTLHKDAKHRHNYFAWVANEIRAMGDES